MPVFESKESPAAVLLKKISGHCIQQLLVPLMSKLCSICAQEKNYLQAAMHKESKAPIYLFYKFVASYVRKDYEYILHNHNEMSSFHQTCFRKLNSHFRKNQEQVTETYNQVFHISYRNYYNCIHFEPSMATLIVPSMTLRKEKHSSACIETSFSLFVA